MQQELSERQLKRIIEVLLGVAERQFDFEPELRLFQFQMWLLGMDGSKRSFDHAALLFGLALIGSRMSRIRKQEACAVDRLLWTVANQRMFRVINVCFAGRSLYDALGFSTLPLWKKQYDASRDEIVQHNGFIERFLQLKYAYSSTTRTGTADTYIEKLMPVGRTVIKDVVKLRMYQEPFLYAATKLEQLKTDYLRFEFNDIDPISPELLLRQLTEKSADRQSFRDLCSMAKSITETLETKLSKGFDVWADVQANRPAVPVPDERLLELGEEAAPRRRRSAEETNVAKRQKVGR